MKIIVLGNGSASPSLERAPSSLLLECKNKYYLFDCGESVQYKLLEYHINFNKITHILISHLHGDHYTGLFGLISTMNSWGREKELTLIAPFRLKEILSLQFKYQNTTLHFDLHFIETNPENHEKIYENKDVTIHTFPLSHRIQTTGFVVKEQPHDYKLLKNKLPENIKIAEIQILKSGKDVLNEDGSIKYAYKNYTEEPQKSKIFAFCSDTIFDINIVQFIRNADVLYHEATFLNEHLQRAETTFHSTASQAATIAQLSESHLLLIGHFSARYNKIDAFESEAKEIFENTKLAFQGLEIDF
ncbi:MAG: ribonuclease Z [Cytophagales bacterium]|nr:MAG: ribonuclease Z [Cytophagales bacterium]